MKRSAGISSASFGFDFENGEQPAKRIARMRSLLLIIPLVASVAHAQQWINTYNMRSFNNVGAAGADVLMSQMIINSRLQDRMMSAAKARGEAAKQNAPAQPKYQFAMSATDFKPAGKRDAPEQLAASSATPEERAQFIEMCRQLQQDIEALPDVRRNNLATAAAILLGSSLQIVARKEMGDAESEDLLRVVNDVIASTSAFNKMTNQQRTAAYDAFLITGALIIGLDASAKETNDPALAALARELALSSLAQFGFEAPNVEPSPQSALVSNPVAGSIRAATPPATQESNANGMLDGIYSGLSSALRASASGGLSGDPSRTYVTFYPDGKVYRRVPEGGLDAWDRATAEADVPALWGTYKPIGPGRWEIRWNESTRVGVVQREGEGLRYEDGMVFPVAACEGLVLDGFYTRPGYEMNPKPDFIAFYPDGRFVDDRLIGALAYQDLNRVDSRTVGPGIGRYQIRRNTLHLDYNDGRRVPVEIHARQEAIAVRPIPVIYINGWELVRVPQ